MGTERGVDLSRRAIRAAKTDLEEVLGRLAPEKAEETGDNTVTPVFQEGGAVSRLNNDPEAMSGFWPAAFGFQTSAYNGIAAVTGAYAGIVTQLESAIELLDQALRNYDGAELDSTQRSNAMRA